MYPSVIPLASRFGPDPSTISSPVAEFNENMRNRACGSTANDINKMHQLTINGGQVNQF